MMISRKDVEQQIKDVERGNVKKDFGRKMLQLKDIHKMDKEDTWEFFHKLGFISSNNLEDRYYSGIHGVWKDEPCYIIGAGPPLKPFLDEYGWDFLDNKHTIGINHTIEDYDRFEWFFFLDKRFLDKTSYNMDNFQGRIFAQATTGLKMSDKVTIFTGKVDKPATRIEQGLYSPNFSGLAALNLALLTGANPIYLIGFGNGKTGSEESYHYKKNYTGEVKKKEIFEKFKRVQEYYNQFKSYKDRVIHVTDGDDMEVFNNKMKVKDFKKVASQVEVTGREPKIVHFSFSDDISIHADITRAIINECHGKHTLVNINDGKIPEADLYIMEHFISTNQKVNRFPYKHKTIDIVHSVNCIPEGDFKRIIVLTDAWKKYLSKRGVNNNVQVMYGGIDLEPYENIRPEFINKTFGRITRWSPGKIHPEWNKITEELLESDDSFKCLMYVDLVSRKRALLEHERMIYDESVKIDDFKGTPLSKLSVYVHANGTFKETMSHAVIEAMTTGLPIVYLSEPAIDEVVGDAGIKCKNMIEVQIAINMFLKNPEAWEVFFEKSKKRAKDFNINRMIDQFNGVIKSCLIKR